MLCFLFVFFRPKSREKPKWRSFSPNWRRYSGDQTVSPLSDSSAELKLISTLMRELIVFVFLFLFFKTNSEQQVKIQELQDKLSKVVTFVTLIA